jgi:hypothetical protein
MTAPMAMPVYGLTPFEAHPKSASREAVCRQQLAGRAEQLMKK